MARQAMAADIPTYSQAQQAVAELARTHGLIVVPSGAGDVRFDASSGLYSDLHLRTAKAWLRSSQIRRDFLGGQMGTDPAWDMLLFLYVAKREGRQVPATSASLASGAPLTTGLRWISVLVERGWVEKSGDASDARRINLRVLDEAVALIERALDAVIASDRRCGLQRMRLIEDVDGIL